MKKEDTKLDSGMDSGNKRYKLTCSTRCHEELINMLEEKFGTVKKVVDMETNIAYKIPIRDIIEKGLTYEDLDKYPLWE